MGLSSEERQKLREIFKDAFLDELSASEPPGVVIIDFMQFVKHLNKKILIKGDMLRHFANKIRYIMFSKTMKIRVVIVLVDGKPVPVKRMVEHEVRYKGVDVFKSDHNPYLPKSNDDLLPNPWIRFAGNYELLRRELYPLLFNAFMFCEYFTPLPGQMLVLSGFPGRSKYQSVNQEAPWNCKTDAANNVLLVVPWNRDELPITAKDEEADPDLYHRVYFLENASPCPEFPQGALLRGEWVDAKNSISEADIRMFYFEHWYQNEHILFSINDGDIFSIGLLYACERVVGKQPHDGKYVFRNKHTVLLPYKKEGEPDDEPSEKKKTEEYVDLNRFYELVHEYSVFREAKVQSPEATMAFLLIMGGSDFFKDFLKGIGSQTIIWPTFEKNAALFSHMIQKSNDLTKSTRAKRELVIDEDMFRRFIYYCYMSKYETAAVKATKPAAGKLTFDQLAAYVKATKNGTKDPKYHMPDRNTCRLWCRQVEWNLNYWINGPFGFDVSPFETWYGLPYYPYVKDGPNSYKMVDVVAHKPKPVDHVFAKHMYAYAVQKKKRGTEENIQAKKQKVVEAMQDKIKN
ncbi:MAG: hypothetical protein K2Q45_06860 [Nitrosomonas sp.]|nr:hypothetical protein [Nitrosomonas sp.]